MAAPVYGPESACLCDREAAAENRTDLFIWRGDPHWWSCLSCDGRVRPLTNAERAERSA